ncbi:MAG: hypothetical protein KDB79_04845 [Acidobacteria bacterium]|nr:hypothetical protein [Acidobacteriota bacterium]
MRTMKNLGNLLVVTAIVLIAALGCRRIDSTDSQFPACVTPDGKKIGFGYGSRNFVIDGNSGKIIKEFYRNAKHAALVCSPKNEILAVYSSEIVNIETEKSRPRRIADSTVIGINSNNFLVGYSTPKIGKRRGEEIELLVERPDDQTDDVRLLKLPLEKLGAVERNRSSFLTLPVRLIKNNELLVFAGGKTRTIPADEFEEFGPDIWGFYRVGLKNGEISPTKAIDKSDDLAGLFNLPLLDATADGKLAAAAFSNTDSKVVFVFDTETGEEIFRHTFDDLTKGGRNGLKLSELQSIAISKDGTTLAVAGIMADYARSRYKKESKIFIYDLKTKLLSSEIPVDDGEMSLISFDKNEIILKLRGKGIVKLDTPGNKVIWRSELPKS